MAGQRKWLRRSAWIVMLLVSVVIGCEDEKSDPTGPQGIDDPGRNNLAGIVRGTVSGEPLAGITVSARGVAAVTDADGVFRLDDVGEGAFGLLLRGASIYQRVAAVNTAAGRVVGIDAIERDSAFDLVFYRELARGNHPNEGHLYRTHRWINPTPPTFYIDTDGSATLDGVIDADQIRAARRVIAQVVSVFSGGFYSSVTIRERAFPQLNLDRDVPDNAFVLSFSDQLILYDAIGYTETDPDFISPSTSSINKAICRFVDDPNFYDGITQEEVLAHEIGHGFGYRHTSRLPSVMVRAGAYGGLFSGNDRLHMAIMYRRPGGNTDLDNDPIPNAKMLGQPLAKQFFVDRRSAFRPTSDLLDRVRALPQKSPDLAGNIAQADAQ